jgi:hypothetical protein
MNWKGCVRKWLWLNFKVLVWNLPGGTEEKYKKPGWIAGLWAKI